MNKLILSILSVIGLLALPVHSLAQTPVDYFKVGQFVDFTNRTNYLAMFTKDALKTKFDDGRQLFVKAGAPPKLLASYDALVKSEIDLPYDKAYNTWSQDQKDTWTKTTLDSKALNNWVGAADTNPLFFYNLGYYTMFMAKTAPLSVSDWGGTWGGIEPQYKSGLKNFVWFQDKNPTVFKTLLPDVQDSIKAIAKYDEKATDPLGVGISKADIAATQQLAAVILTDAIANGKLTQ